MAVTESSLREEIEHLVYSAQPQARPYQDEVQNNPLASGGTTLTVLDGTQWSEGDVVDFDDDGDQAMVTAISTNDLTIRRIGDDTSHAQGTVVYRNPRWSHKAIGYAIQHIIDDLFPDVYIHATNTQTYDPQQQWYPINDSQLTEVVSVFYEDDEYLTPVPLGSWRQWNGLPGAEFTQSEGVYIPGSMGMDNGDSFYVVYRKVIGSATDLYDRQAVIVVHGAAYRLLLGANAVRTHDPSRWTDRTVQPGQEGRDSVNFLREYFQLRRREELRLSHDEDRLPKHPASERARRFRH